MAGFSRFLKRWASTGALLEPSDAQANAGFAFLGATPPSVEMFNAMMQQYDDKDNTLYAWIAAVLTAAGITPADGSPGQLLAALNFMLAAQTSAWQAADAVERSARIAGDAHGMQVFTASGTFTPPVAGMLVKRRVWGGGAGGGASSGNPSAASGGGAGAYAEGWAMIAGPEVVTIGAGGLGASSTAVAAGIGGPSKAGAVITCTGGTGGSNAASSFQSAIGEGGTATGGQLNVNGIGGGQGLSLGAAGWGGNGGGTFGSTLALGGGAGTFPGGGGGGGSNGNPGATGAGGLVIYDW